MSDMGFLPGVKRLLNRTPDNRQTLLFSATLDGDVAVLARNYQRDPVRHEIGDPEPNVEDMRHLFWRLESSGRVEVASNLIQAAGPTIVFCRTRRGADRVARQLERAGASAAAIHGSRSQSQRNRALQSFADGKVEALVATDVAARGIHVEGVACVLHFDPPIDHKTYVHRSGRTARARRPGRRRLLRRPRPAPRGRRARSGPPAPRQPQHPRPCLAAGCDRAAQRRPPTPASPTSPSRSRMPRTCGAGVLTPARPPSRLPAGVAATTARALAAPSPAQTPRGATAGRPRTPATRRASAAKSARALAAARARTAAARVRAAGSRRGVSCTHRWLGGPFTDLLHPSDVVLLAVRRRIVRQRTRHGVTHRVS